ncbi:uncharacterized protein LOC105704184 isoform X1 [Orussus abietinus]|uniref:uncharacterized protein LOC105704184 isoform X1 n=1 Tax=Orussus abietinus TaxID=222816 RepID=UPI0006252CF4|nr:uncharacterized protein LOC105704184 isoform X1 [Orussus abietinus]
MSDNDVEARVLQLYRDQKWQDIIDLGSINNDKEKRRLLWVWPSEDDLYWIRDVVTNRALHGIISIGCGSGLLEWLIKIYTGINIIGVEIDKPWWVSRHSPPQFLKDIIFVEHKNQNIKMPSKYALLFCYFNNASAFYEYMKNFEGNTVLVIGPMEGQCRFTDPLPFDEKFSKLGWQLSFKREIIRSKDLITVYVR